MIYTYPMWVENLVGGETKAKKITVGATAVKVGDFLQKGASDDLVIPMTVANQMIVGVATSAGAVGAEIFYIPTYFWNVFAIKCKATKDYTDTVDKFNLADVTDFTSGDMRIDPGTSTADDVLMIGLADGETDSVAENVVLCIFMDTPYTNTGR